MSFPVPPFTFDQEEEAAFRLLADQAIADAVANLKTKDASRSATLASGSNNNFDSGLAGTTIKLTPDAAGSTLSGIIGRKGEVELTLINVGNGPTITLTHQDTNSTAENRFIIPGGGSFVLSQDAQVKLRYDDLALRWRVAAITVPAAKINLGPWHQSNVADGGGLTSGGFTALLYSGLPANHTQGGDGSGGPYVAQFPGSIVGIVVAVDGPRVAGTATVEAFINNTGTGLQAVINGTDTAFAVGNQAAGLDVFAAGDRLYVRVDYVGFNVTAADFDIQAHLVVIPT